MSSLLEADFQTQVTQAAERMGWSWMHPKRVTVKRPDGRTYAQTPLEGPLATGWPDLVLVRERVVFAELKSDRGVVAPSQREVHAALTAAGAEVHLWRPRDWDHVVRVLARREPARP